MTSPEAIRLQHPTRWATRDWWPTPNAVGVIKDIILATGGHDEQLEKWHCTSRNMFRHLAQADLHTLLFIMNSGLLSETELTVAAEFLAGSEITTTTDIVGFPAIDMLFALLRDDRAVVREGAIMGLHGSKSARATRWVRRMAQTDLSPGVRQAASDFLEAHSD